jgi:hypothetical protein
MDQYFDLMRNQFERACSQGAHRPWWRRRVDIRPARVIAVAASTAVVVAVVLVAFEVGGTRRPSGPTGSSRPPLTMAQRRRVANTVGRILARNPGCGHVRPRRNLSISYGGPDSEMLSTLGVLRQGATSADGFRPFRHSPVMNVAHGIFVRYVRLARTYRGTEYYIIPAADIGSMDQRCVAAERSALRKALPDVPAALRSAVEQQFNAIVAQDSPQQGVFLILKFRNGQGSSSPAGIQEIRTQGGDFGLGSTGDSYLGDRNLTLTGIVPDGVASVTVRIPLTDGRPLVLTTRPVENVVVAPVRLPERWSRGGPATMVWKAPDGHVIRVIRNAPF